jgi:hypothetical protein
MGRKRAEECEPPQPYRGDEEVFEDVEQRVFEGA